jgi:outer membrane murein-binding lipoprotein Lpp
MAAAGMSPTTIGAAVASALAGAGYAKTAQDVTTATQAYTTQATQAALTQRVEQQKAALAGTPYYPSVTSSSFNTTDYTVALHRLKDLPRFAEGGILGAGQWGIAGESGPELIRGPAQVVPQKAQRWRPVNTIA